MRWAADLVRGFAREFAAEQARSIYVIRVKVGEFPSGAEMLRHPRREWPELVAAVAARLGDLRSKAQRAGIDEDDLNMKYLRELSAIKLLADRLLKPRLAFNAAQFSTIIDIAVENLDLLSQQGGLYWKPVVPRTLLVRQAEYLVGSGPAAPPLAAALKRLGDALRSRDPALQERVLQLLRR